MEPIAPGTFCKHSEPYEAPNYMTGTTETRMTECYDMATHRSEAGKPVCRRHAEALFGVPRGGDLPPQAGQSLRIADVGLGRKVHLVTGDMHGGGYIKCRGDIPQNVNEPEEIPAPASIDRASVAEITDRDPYFRSESDLCPKCFPRKK